MSVKLADLRVLLPTEVRVEDLNQQRPATVADLVLALRAEGVLVVEKVGAIWPDWAIDPHGADYHHPNFWRRYLDALAEAQPFPPAGG